jgi:ATP-dependent DNA helicase RecQ
MIALTESAACRTRALLACFGEDLGGACGHCDNCTGPVGTFDGTTEAQKVLSAVYRTGQRFGAVHVVSVLMGKATDAVAKWQHDRLPTFGVGADRPDTFWRGVIRQLVARGALHVQVDPEEGRFSSLILVDEKARPILRGEDRVMLREDARPERDRAPRARAGRAGRAGAAAAADPSGGGAGGGPGTDTMFEALRQWRAAEARAQSVPPYVIFHDSVLRDIASSCPASLDELGQIKGVGASKLARYGARVLGVVRGGG